MLTAEKAEEVFLLFDGLHLPWKDFETTTGWNFERRLEVLPPDLEDLYSHMLNKMQPLYLRQASQLFQILPQHREFEVDESFSALQLSLADEEKFWTCIQPQNWRAAYSTNI